MDMPFNPLQGIRDLARRIADNVRRTVARWLGSKDLSELKAWFDAEATEGFLDVILSGMALAFRIHPEYRRNIDGFQGRYQFLDRAGNLQVGVLFNQGRMSVHNERIDHPDITITFRDEKSLMGFVLSPKPDILGATLRQDVILSGNLNYLYKFAFMAKRLQLIAAGKR